MVILMSAFLGASSLGIGLLPLSITYSRARLTQLTNLGTGLLLGAALGIIIPEGIENLVESLPAGSETPTSAIALSLLVGFTLMLLVEQLISPHSHNDNGPLLPHAVAIHPPTPGETANEPGYSLSPGYDMHDFGNGGTVGNSQVFILSDTRTRALPLTLGLVVHSLADGLALGASALQGASDDQESSELSFVVFLALLVHKAPTALALTTSLLSTSLSRYECRHHILAFSLATPLGAILSYTILSFWESSIHGGWTGIALLISGGSFLYVATVLQPVSDHSSAPSTAGNRERVALIVTGVFFPFLVASFIGHGHGHGGSSADLTSGT